MTDSTEQDIVERFPKTNPAIEQEDIVALRSWGRRAIAEITHLRAERDAAAQEAVRWKGVAKIEAEGRQRMTELGQQAHDQAHAAARDMRERAAKLVETGVISAGGCITDHRQKIVAAAIRALPDTVVVIATERETSNG